MNYTLLNKICIAASLIACTSTFAQQPAKVLQVMRNGTVIASFNLTSDMSLSVTDADAEGADDDAASVRRAAPFPEDDGSKALSKTTAVALKNLVTKMDRNRALDMGETYITEEQFAEIRKFVDENLVGSSTVLTCNNIFNWIKENVKVAGRNETAYLDPYDVFVYKKCVCQGYANLFKTMMLTQGFPSFIANGWLGTIGGHAWNYTYDGKRWRVFDPTNGPSYTMTSTSNYQNSLIPLRADLNLFEDESFCYGFEEGYLNINEVKPGAPDELAIPFGVENYRIAQFAPRKAIPENVRSISLGQYISSLGQYPNMLSEKLPGVEEILVDPNNRDLESHKGVVYLKNSNSPYFIPPRMTRVELKPMERMEKNAIYDLAEVEEIVIAEGTKIIEAYAIENCPKLRRVYVPQSVTSMDEQAIYRCPADVEVIWVTTGIRDVRM